MIAFIEFQLNEHTLETRICRISEREVYRRHAGFTEEDSEAGWQQKRVMRADELDAEEIEAHRQEIVQNARNYWEEYLPGACQDEARVIVGRRHYVMAPAGTGSGFGGQRFRVTWLDPTRPPVIGNLSVQGDIPDWVSARYPANAARVEELKSPKHGG